MKFANLNRISLISLAAVVLAPIAASAQPRTAGKAEPAATGATPTAAAPSTTPAPLSAAGESAPQSASDVSGAASTTAPAGSAAPQVAASESAATAAAPVTTFPQQPAPLTAVEVAPAEPAPAALPVAGYDKAFFIQSTDGNYRVEIGGRVQPRFTYEASAKVKDKAYFSVNRAELRLSGNVFQKALTYKFEADFGKGSVNLKDFYFDYAVLPNAFQLRLGQFKKPFSRTGIASSGNLETTERAITDGRLGASGRDQGIMLHNNFDKSPTFEWALGLFNGVGERPWFTGKATGAVKGTTNAADGTYSANVTGSVDKDAKFNIVPNMFTPQLVARLGYNYGDLKGYSEADLEGGPLRFGVAGSGALDFDADGGKDSLLRGELDAVLKISGLSVTGGYYCSNIQTGKNFGNRNRGDKGFHAQAGYVISSLVQPVVRIGQYNKTGKDNTDTELLAGVSVYPYKHSLKWQTDVTRAYHQTGHTSEWLVRSQAQLNF